LFYKNPLLLTSKIKVVAANAINLKNLRCTLIFQNSQLLPKPFAVNRRCS